MNKRQIIGLILLVIGIIMYFSLENDVTSYISGALLGSGIGIFLTVKWSKPVI